MSYTGADLLVESLIEAGVRYLFSLSGNQIMPVFDATVGRDIGLMHTRHEAAAVHMADAWGRLPEQPGVALLTAGPGALQCRLRPVRGPDGRITPGDAERTRSPLSTQPRGISGDRSGGHGQAGHQGSLDGGKRRPARWRFRKCFLYRTVGAARPRPPEPAGRYLDRCGLALRNAGR